MANKYKKTRFGGVGWIPVKTTTENEKHEKEIYKKLVLLDYIKFLNVKYKIIEIYKYICKLNNINSSHSYYLPCVKHYAGHFTYIISFNHNHA